MTAKTNNESIKSHIMIKILLNTIQIHKSTDIRTTKNHVKRLRHELYARKKQKWKKQKIQ